MNGTSSGTSEPLTVRTRFAPSPTGYLHIGGVRTALFNWLFARRHGGQFILRIDDTDQQRNVQEALQPILDGFRWLGLDWDEGPEVGGHHGPYYQSQKLERYRAAVNQLVESGHAYWDYASPEEWKAERESAEKEKRPYLYSRRWLAETPLDRARFSAEGRAGVVRLKMPREGTCEFHDLIRGDMRFPWAGEQDSVVQRADGSVLYNLASVVDDFDMKISHVVRAEEHLSNTPRQVFIARALGYPLPAYAHVPFVAEPGSKNKLSKRKIAQYLKNADFRKVFDHGKAIADRLGLTTAPETFNPVIVDFYREVGYLPDAILNYLVLLGWSLDDKTEDFTRQQMVDLFSLERVNKAAASFDAKKLSAFQERWMQALPVTGKIERILPYLQRLGISPDMETLKRVMTEAGPRLVVAGDILDYDFFFVADERVSYDEKALEKHLRNPPGPALLPKLRSILAAAEPFDGSTLKRMVEELAAAENVKPGPVSQMLRVATTGKEVGFGTYETLAILGRDRCLARIDQAWREYRAMGSDANDNPDLARLRGVVAPEILKAVEVASRMLHEAGIPHALAGGLAVGAHGYPRTTDDVDFLVGDEAFVIHAGGLVTLKAPLIAVGNVRVDLISLRESAGEGGQLRPAVDSPRMSEQIPIVPLRALIHMKLKAGRQRDTADLVELLKRGTIDIPAIDDYLHRHAPELSHKWDRTKEMAALEE